MTSSSRDGARTRQPLLFLLKVVVSLTLLAWLFAQLDLASLTAQVARASLPWLIAALAIYLLMILASAWRWQLLLEAQQVALPQRLLVGSFLVATFFNNFLPSNIGGDVVRIRDTTPGAGSVTRATAVVIVDRALGLIALLLLGAIAASAAGLMHPRAASPVPPALLWAGFLASAAAFVLLVSKPGLVRRLLAPVSRLRPRLAEWTTRLTGIVEGFSEQPGRVAACFVGAILVQAILVAFYAAVALSLRIPISIVDLAVVVPVSFVVQLLPVSVNGFGVREATFTYYFTALGLPVEGAVALSLVAAGLIMLFSLSGGLLFMVRGTPRQELPAR
ncbi:MAG TPA: lysylphosphatidylglycerol synthase transmembrane domain-containing protein [Vicinamibacterales bacterium]